MASLIPGFEYDIFISYRQKDNKGDRWVSEFVDSFKTELESTFKEEISVYFDINPHNGLLETHDVDASLRNKLKCLVFIPIISRTYCDPKSFAWEHEFKAFVELASQDKFGLKIILPDGNVGNRILPVRIHDLDVADIKECESVLHGVLRGVEFIYKEPGVNRSLTSKDNEEKNLNHTNYRNQINKVALAIKDIIKGMKIPAAIEQVPKMEIKPDIEGEMVRYITPVTRKHNLPISRTSFIGREKELKEVRDLFQKSRLVTLTGAGGCGKTRLAREIASTLIEEYKDGVWFVDLAPVSDPNYVAKAITGVLSIKETPDKTIIDTLIENIKDKTLLILLDNCEHLIQVCAEVADNLLQSVNGIRILATSREALNIPGEVIWGIPLLSLPDPGAKKDLDEIQRYEAIKLFIDRADAGKPGFTLNHQNMAPIIGICQRVSGIPLAIELAATRIRHLGPEAILERLEDQFKILSSTTRRVPERQQTLKATIDWSYKLLSEQEQLLFIRLSVFAGDFSLEAVEEVCSDGKIEKENILILLSQLVDKSLVNSINKEDESVRYKCLDPLRHYTLQKLIESGEEEKQRKQQLSYYLKMAEQAYKEQFRFQLKWMNRLEQEYDNLISALNWSFTQSIENFILLSGYLVWFWEGHSYYSAGKDYLEKALAKSVSKTEAYARVLAGMGILIYNFANLLPRTIIVLKESLEIWHKINNLWEEANILRWLSGMYSLSGDYDNALKSSKQSLESARKTGDPGLINICLSTVCMRFVFSKKWEQAIPYIEEFLMSSEKLEQPQGILIARHFHSDCTLGLRNFKEAEKRYAFSMETALKYGHTFIATNDLHGVAYSVSGQSRWIKAIRLDGAARENYRIMELNIRGLMKFWDEFFDTYIEGARKKLGKELTLKYEEEGRNMGFEAAVKYALDFEKD
jgi:predicted ATPase